MDYGFDASGTDDDVAPEQAGRSFKPGRVDGNRKETSGAYTGQKVMGKDVPLRKLEYDAYVAVLRAFTKRTGALAWDKCEIMAKLREHLRITMDQHLSILQSIESNSGYCSSREQKFQDDEHRGSLYVASSLLATDVSHRKQKIIDASPGTLRPGTKTLGPPSPSSGPGFSGRRGVSAVSGKNKPAAANGSAMTGSLIGRRVQTRWPDDNAFYEAQITEYNPQNDTHALVYNAGTQDETWEWVNVKELLSSGDLRFVDGGPSISITGKGPVKNRVKGSKTLAGKDRGGKARSLSKGPVSSFEELTPSGVHGRNWEGSTIQDVGFPKIQLPSLDALMKQVDRISREDDLAKIESVKRAAKEHEEMLQKALAEIGEFSDEEDSSGCQRESDGNS